MPEDASALQAAAIAQPPAVQAKNLSLVFQTADAPVSALSDVNLTVERGEFVSFIGPSGCGKTTLMRVIADLERATAGSIRVNGMTPGQAREQRAYGYVFQAAALYPWRSVLKNVMLPLEIMGLPLAEQRRRATEQLAKVGLEGFERKFPWQLSGGMQQRVSIARAMAFEPKLLLMDEPFGALDEITRDHLNEQLLRLWERTGKTVIFVTHSISEAVFLSNRIVVMSPRPGRIIEIIHNPLPSGRTLDVRETPAFAEVAHQVRVALRAGHSYD
jgi:NitT/TauT family transport system ATP-binding protein